MKVHQRHDTGLRCRQSLDEAFTWRRRSLLLAGFPETLAAAVATDLRFDLHTVLQLVDRGCAPTLAIEILEPLPSEMRS